MMTDRLLPLGEAADGAWIAERTVRATLMAAARGVRGVAPERPRFRLAEGRAPDSDAGGSPGGAAPDPSGGEAPGSPGGDAPLPVPPGGLPPAPLRITLDFAAVAGRPLRELADRLRTALLETAEGSLGLSVAEVDLRVTDLLDAPPEFAAPTEPPGGTSPPAPDDPAALAALAVPGVAALTDAFGGPVTRTAAGVRVEVAVTSGHRPLDVARALRTAVTAAAPGATTVTVVVSDVR
ncbi:hypothetical protein ACFY8W_16705 [Streptomyces sp. NPDC012637]|uniref:hypothetical protein n=1 Tax=Streptomyces sp. NPDC012637 TaxID=3364842 RepID=UPI0036E05F25